MKIVHASNPRRVLALIGKAAGTSSLLALEPLQKQEYAALPAQRLQEISLADLPDDELQTCEQAYIRSVAELGKVYNSVEWWANPLSEKNEHLSKHYRHLILFYRLVKTLRSLPAVSDPLFVLCDHRLSAQLGIYCSRHNIEFETLDGAVHNWIRSKGRRLYKRIAGLYFILNKVFRKVLAGILFRSGRGMLAGSGRHYVIRTWLDDRFIKEPDGAPLPFFGKLPEYAAERGYSVLILAGMVGHFRALVSAALRTCRFTILPEECFIRYTDLARLFSCWFARGFPLKVPVLFNGIDMSLLYQSELEDGFRSPAYLGNMFAFFLARQFGKTVEFGSYVQTFENYAWEKMMLLGLRQAGAKGTLIGFQHAFISRNSFKYFPGRSEQGLMPLPDRIVTRGAITREILQRYGSYPPSTVVTGCALRQEYLGRISPVARRHHRKVLVPLTMVPRESARVLDFLIESGISGSGISVVVRCHPMAPVITFKRYISRPLPENFTFSNEKSVAQEMSTADVVLYTWTTVAIEAVLMGVPVIFLDVLRPLYVDPLFECGTFKRTVRVPGELLDRIHELQDMRDALFEQERTAAHDYLKKDFYPVTEQNLVPFFAGHDDGSSSVGPGSSGMPERT